MNKKGLVAGFQKGQIANGFSKSFARKTSYFEIKLKIKKGSHLKGKCFLLTIMVKGQLFHQESFPCIFPKNHERYSTQCLLYTLYGFVILYRHGLFEFK